LTWKGRRMEDGTHYEGRPEGTAGGIGYGIQKNADGEFEVVYWDLDFDGPREPELVHTANTLKDAKAWAASDNEPKDAARLARMEQIKSESAQAAREREAEIDRDREQRLAELAQRPISEQISAMVRHKLGRDPLRVQNEIISSALAQLADLSDSELASLNSYTQVGTDAHARIVAEQRRRLRD
jgi:hypothetical protein